MIGPGEGLIECPPCRFEQQFTDACDAERVNASLADSLLDVTLEKRPEVLSKTIEIEAR